VGTAQRDFENFTRECNALTSQVVDICENLLKQQGGLGIEARKWLTPDIRTWLTIVSQWLAVAIRNHDGMMRQLRNELENETVGHLVTGFVGTPMLMTTA
jgi:hypothetical protein